MTDDLERLEALARAATPGPWHELVDDRILARGPNPAIPLTIFQFWTRPKVQDATFIAAANPAAILSLIQRVREAEAAALQERKDSNELLLIAHLNGADMGRKAGRAEALEEAAKVAEGWPTISAGDEYMTNGNGRYWDAGTPYDQSRVDAAAAIRALGEKAG